jgi:hypothetical protein
MKVLKVKFILQSRLMNYGIKTAEGAGCVIGVRKGEDIMIEGRETKQNIVVLHPKKHIKNYGS